MAESSGRELGEAAAAVEGPSHDERLVPDERGRRALARESAGGSYGAAPETPWPTVRDDYRRRRQAAETAYGVRPDDEVSTDAVMAVTQEAGDWRARWVLAEQGGTLVIRSLSLEPTTRVTPPAGITSAFLRALSPSRIASQAAHAALQGFPGQDPWWTGLRVTTARQDVVEHQLQERPATRPGRPRLADDLLRDVALAYLEEARLGRGVLRRLSERFDRPEATMRDWVRIARREGWLGPAVKSGSRGGDPGPRLLQERDLNQPEQEDQP